APDGYATREQFAAIIERYDGSFRLIYNAPVLRSHYTEKEYPLVTDADFYVSTNGSDDNDGSFDHPFRTWERARDAVRGLDKTGRSGIKVAFMAGEYGPLDISLTSEDSGTPECPITYCKYGDGDVVFNNGFDLYAESFEPIGEDEKKLFSAKAAGAVRKVDASAVISSGIDPDDFIMYGGRGLCDEARYPDKWDDGTDNLLYGAGYGSADTLIIINPVLAGRIAKYPNDVFGTMKIRGYIKAGYNKSTFRAAGYDAETATLTIDERDIAANGKMRDWMGVTGLGIEICVTNVSYELDKAGEYWIDPGTKTLYVYSPDGDYFIPSGGLMIKMEGVNDVAFRGLTFKNSAGGFIDASVCHGETLELCSFLNTSAQKGVYFYDNSLERPMALTVRECTFENAYGQALFADGNNLGEHRFDKREDIVFDNNLVRATNVVYDAWNGVRFDNCAGVTVTHNRFEDCSRGAVSFMQSYDILVEYNDFDSAMCDSHDGGVIYTDWICDARNFVVRYNCFGYVPTVGAGQFGLYLDEFTSGTEVYSNVFYQAGNSAIMYSLGRDNVFRDNAVICGRFNGTVGWGTATRDEIEE
ncbi:MAG: right-handed parallel beta-helix repeat-containing protein, partial [Clostridia bacterium]|nr:right-handed parallel beta-helix repeat-containing protein [Clostridia bacterium]